MDANTDMAALGTAAGYVVVTPTAPHQALGNRIWRPELDVAQVASTLRGMVSSDTGRIDRLRVHAAGFSMGGFMTWALLCEVPETLCSIAPAAASGLEAGWNVGGGATGFGSTCFSEAGGAGPDPARPVYYASGMFDLALLAPVVNVPLQVAHVQTTSTLF